VPGQNLGATGTGYGSQYHTVASASYVRVILREDNLGLGAIRGKANGETFGLELLSGLLGRLNGKSEDQLVKEEAARRDVRLMRYQNDKHGLVGFVFGGFLVGDEIKQTVNSEDDAKKLDHESSKPEKKPQLKKRKRDKNTLQEVDIHKGMASATHTPTNSHEIERNASSDSVEESKQEKKRRKEEKRARKEARRSRREHKDAKVPVIKTDSESSTQDVSDNANDRDIVSASASASQSGTSTPLFGGGRGRNVLRQRYIQQKKMACMDEKSLREVSGFAAPID
jgi:Pin2-interacting protein X1